MIRRAMGSVFAFSVFMGCVSDKDELLVVDMGHEEQPHADKNNTDVKPVSDALEGDESSAMTEAGEEIEDASGALTEGDVFVEDLQSEVSKVTRAPAPAQSFCVWFKYDISTSAFSNT